MKFYPNADVWFNIDQPNGWDQYDRYPKNHSWKMRPFPTKMKEMRYWRDSEGIKMDEVQRKDLYIKDVSTSRIRKEACLGMLYATGFRFIKIAKAPPAGFKCAPLPVNLATARAIKETIALKKKEAAAAAKAAKKAAKEAAKGKGKGKGKGKKK